MKTHITLLIDRSGSMQDIRSDAEGAVNAFLEDQAAVDGDCTVLVADFDSSDRFRIALDNDIKRWTPYSLEPRGSTPLYDAIGRAISTTGARVELAADIDKVVVVIVTDGGENCSVEFDRDKALALIKEREAAGWEFVFLAAGTGAFLAARAFVGTNMHLNNTVVATATASSYAGAMRATSTNLSRSRGGQYVNYAALVDDDGSATDPNS